MKWEKIEYPWCHLSECKTCDIGKCMELFNEFVQFFGFDRMCMAESVGSYDRLLHGCKTYNNTQLNYNHFRNYENVPEHDHARIFKIKGTNRILYVNQPYQFDQNKLEKWCNERGLFYVICDRKYSFYYPEHTEMVLIMSMQTYNEFLRIPYFPLKWKKAGE